ncbi:hypothetical protein [uncultured Friedmanniella sp.]|uniref:hypothetical protein n=1 Tax=uncultured Friedmanniella sp. TaxID=335381 RepID=UPI0035C9FF2C
MTLSTDPPGTSVPAPAPAPTDAASTRALTWLAALARAYRWHRPLMLLSGASSALLVVSVAGYVLDPRVLTGVPIWEKPAKFALSVAVYAFTLGWLISLMPRRRRLGSVLGTVSAVMLAGELVAIVTQVVRGRTSHFDFATPFDAAVYQAMAVMVGTLWLANVALVVWLLTQRLPDLVLTWTLRLGMIISVIGMALAFLMTLPTPAQRESMAAGGAAAVVGAHTVGLPDGGPGLPFLGWSTVGGDLRIPHFVGLHGLQTMIVLGLVLALLGQRFPLLAAETVRLRLVLLAAAAYVGLLAILTWQALRGQSVVRPDATTATATAALAALTLTLGALVLRPRPTGSRRRRSEL